MKIDTNGISHVHTMYGAAMLSLYEKAVIHSLKNGPKTRNELFKEIYPKVMSEKKLQETLNELEDEERITCVPKRVGETHKWTSYYALREHKYLLEVDLAKVADAVKYLRLELCRNPEVEEVAAKIGKYPESVAKLLFKHAPDLKWKPPTSEEKEEAKKLHQKALELATQTKYGLHDDIDISEVSMEDVKRAAFLIKHQFSSIKQEHLPFRGVVLGPGLSTPRLPSEKSKKETEATVQKLRRLKEGK